MKAASFLNNYGKVKIMLKSPMLGKEEAKRTEIDIGKKIDTHYITNLKVKANEKLIYSVKLTPCISKNPFFKFSYKDIKALSLTLDYTDNIGNRKDNTVSVRDKKYNQEITQNLKLSKNPKTYPNKIKSIRKLFGDITLIEDGIQLKVPEIVSNQRSIPINIRSNIKFKSIALFVNSHYPSYGFSSTSSNYSDCETLNQFNLVAQWFSTPYSIADFDIRIKMRNSGEVLVVLKAENGKFYTIRKKLKIAIGGGDI